MSGGDLLYH